MHTRYVNAFIIAVLLLMPRSEATAQWINDTSAKDATKLVIAPDGSVWTIYKWYESQGPRRETGVQRFKNGSWNRFGKANGLADDSVRDMTLDKQGNIWLAGKKGLSKFNGEVWETVTIKDTAEDRREFTAIACDSSGRIWTTSCIYTYAGTQGGNTKMDKKPAIHKYDGSNWTTYWPQAGFEMPNSEIPYIECDGQENVYAFGYQANIPPTFGYGFHWYNGSEWRTLNEGGHSTSKHAKQPTGLACAKDGSVWLSFVFSDDSKLVPGNLHRYQKEIWTGYDTSSGLPYGSPQALAIDPQGRKWLGYNTASGAGIWIFDQKVVKQYTKDDNSMLRTGVSAIAFAGEDAYVSTPYGLTILKRAISNVTERMSQQALAVFPNPTSNYVSIVLPKDRTKSIELRVVDQLGRHLSGVLVMPEEGQIQRINVSDLPAGRYHITSQGTLSPQSFTVLR